MRLMLNFLFLFLFFGRFDCTASVDGSYVVDMKALRCYTLQLEFISYELGIAIE